MGAVLLVCLALYFTGISAWMCAKSSAPADEEAQTVVVLGCKVNGDQPGEMLRRRLDAALVWLNGHPQADVVVSGGKERDGGASEAAVMRDYLIAHGIDSGRIILEDRAQNTQENLRFSARLLEERGSDNRVVIVTDSWHQLRASLFAQKAGLDSTPLSCRTEWYFLPGYWCRELLALTRALLLGY